VIAGKKKQHTGVVEHPMLYLGKALPKRSYAELTIMQSKMNIEKISTCFYEKI
jgi:hypothetical protein